jgi:hypothetical protein
MTTPYYLAFVPEDDEARIWPVINWVIDSFFIVDVVIIFNSCYYDDEF